MKKRTPLLLLFALSGAVSLAQSASPQLFSTAGGSGTSPSAKLSWSVGEPITETAQGSSNTLTQGFQQAELDISTALPDSSPEWGATVFPNPSTSYIEINLDAVPGNATITLYSSNGEQVLTERMNGRRQMLDVSRLAAGTYLLDLYDAVTGRRARFNLNKTN